MTLKKIARFSGYFFNKAIIKTGLNSMTSNKIKASLIHFFISFFCIAIILGIIIYFWYPLDYLGITSFKDLVILIIGVDLILGPILTFVVFQPNKKSLKFDLSAIVFVQIAALAYGIHYLYLAHPVYITYAKGSFTLVNANLANPNQAKYTEYKISKLRSLTPAYAEIPKDRVEYNKLFDESMSGGADLEERADLYKPYNDNIEKILENTLNKALIYENEYAKRKLTKIITNKNNKIDKDKVAFLPLEGSTKDAIVIIDKNTAKPITTIQIDPWQFVKK